MQFVWATNIKELIFTSSSRCGASLVKITESVFFFSESFERAKLGQKLF